MELGYARVSSREQDTTLQVNALRAAAVTAFWEEQQSGIKHRDALEELLTFLQPGDVLVVYKVDRLARSLSDLLRIADRITAAGAQLRSLTEPIETISPIGRVIFQLLGAFAEFERNVIHERCQAGREAALARGVKFGRPAKIDYDEVFRMRNAGHTFGEISQIMSIARSQAVFIVRKMKSRAAGASLAGPGSMPSAPSP
jgi:DNA invertase Pin-like site-specific DNA recombinase